MTRDRVKGFVRALVALTIAAAPAVARADEPVVLVDALRFTAGQAVVGARVVNRDHVGRTDVSVRFDLPAGSTLDRVLTAPRGASVTAHPGYVEWTIDSLPAGAIVGPFACRVWMANSPPASFTVRWREPQAGAATATLQTVEDATQASVAATLSAGIIKSLPKTGVSYFVRSGGQSVVSLRRLAGGPPPNTAPGLGWVGFFEVEKAQGGPALLNLPLAQPAAPYSVVRVHVQGTDGVFREQPTRGMVARDGLHATFAAESSGRRAYALGVQASGLAGLTSLIDRGAWTDLWIGDLAPDLMDFESIVGVEYIDALIASVTGGDFGVTPGSDADLVGADAQSGSGDGDLDGRTDQQECGGSGYTGRRVYQGDSGGWFAATECGNGSWVVCRGSVSEGSRCSQHELGFFPGPCPVFMCFSQGGTDYTYGNTLLPPTLLDLFDQHNGATGGLSIPEQQEQWGAGGTLDSSPMVSVVGMVGDVLLNLIPQQAWQLVPGAVPEP